MYQVGLMETDKHIQYFWNTLEGLSQEDLCRFIKFACNQERIPQTCPCKDGGPDTAHVPPYPMKIAPPDGGGIFLFINCNPFPHTTNLQQTALKTFRETMKQLYK